MQNLVFYEHCSEEEYDISPAFSLYKGEVQNSS